ncbi:Putative RNA-directed DNA polymerase (reverse transcriptase) [Bradyrhizobium sp. ORS 285]|uniref:reverse transcriptase family protein n=1 Tax=Bradyrhizobium sp. ORS 285 TaxID=115808 RepID=UPI0002409A06|nr:reverse transcriptase family protein [Bradyrhizobium sp. ORS 285]CCD85177.1 putative RNA-directed DNA polymerase (reverse transcriptase) [Bradyrhizobium sp. ORS 285]SMX58183.1 Putative RNA-directed DNA polymerase (reverse transcriptase) [Bradyrhizobium sp. ORS 285]
MTDTVSPGKLSRQELYDRIRQSSKDEVILEEMIRLGFWPEGEGAPAPAAEAIRNRAEAIRELAELQRQNAALGDPVRALKEMHKRRKAEAMARRQETRRRHAEARQTRAFAWYERRKRDVLYLGEDVSQGLHSRTAVVPLRDGLPPLADAKALADAMGIALAELRFLAFNRKVASVNHYQRFTIPKKSGGERLISAPMPRLKRAQYWVLDNILGHVPLHEAAHGFAPERSTLTNARNHVGRDVVINLDLKDFFPTLTYVRVKGLFEALGYAEAVAIPLALLCTEPMVDEVTLDGERHYIADGPRLLPQGAPTSPAITNLICRKLDRRLAGLARTLGFVYSRYADDMTFSGSGEAVKKIGTLLKAVNGIVEAEGFTVHPDKTRVMRRSARQEVTGLTVNEAVAVPRDLMRRYRAVLQQVERHGPAGKHFGPGKDVIRSLLGFGHFAVMVDPESGAPLLQRAQQLAARYAPTPSVLRPTRAAFRKAAAAGQTPPGRQWTPAVRPPPAPDPVLVALARQEEKKQAAQAHAAAASPSRPPNVPPPSLGSIPVNGPWGPGTADAARAAKKKRPPWYVTTLVILLALLLAVAIAPAGPAIAGGLLYFYFSRWWKR